MIFLEICFTSVLLSVILVLTLLFGMGRVGKIIFLGISLWLSLAPLFFLVTHNKIVPLQQWVLNRIKMSNFFIFAKRYFLFLYWSSYETFLYLTVFFGAVFLGYLSLAKYLLYLEIKNLHEIFNKPLVLVLLFILLQVLFILRLFHNFTIFLLNFLMLTEGFTPEPPSNKVSTHNNYYSFYHRATHRHSSNTPPDWGRKMATHLSAGRMVAVGGLVLSCGAVYCYYQSMAGTWEQVRIAQEQVIATEIQNTNTQKTHAQWEVTHGFRTPESYEKEFCNKSQT
jgi:hypothetical protein